MRPLLKTTRPVAISDNTANTVRPQILQINIQHKIVAKQEENKKSEQTRKNRINLAKRKISLGITPTMTEQAALSTEPISNQYLNLGKSDSERTFAHNARLLFSSDEQEQASKLAEMHNSFFLGNNLYIDPEWAKLHVGLVRNIIQQDAKILPTAMAIGATTSGINTAWKLIPQNIKTVGSNLLNLGAGIEASHNLIGENGIRKTYNQAKKGNVENAVISGLGDVFNGAIALTGLGNYGKGVWYRGLETAMRTSPGPNPIPDVKAGFNAMTSGKNGGVSRLGSIGNYILTGWQTKTPGYYNSFIASPKCAFSGFRGRSFDGSPGAIDTYLYEKPISEVYEWDPVKKTTIQTTQGVINDYGAETGFVQKYYKSRDPRITIYEDRAIPESGTTEYPERLLSLGWHGRKDPLYVGNGDILFNMGGHRVEYAKDPITGQIYSRSIDLWKFNAPLFIKRWDIKNKLLLWGLKAVDKSGVPFVTRTKWGLVEDPSLVPKNLKSNLVAE